MSVVCEVDVPPLALTRPAVEVLGGYSAALRRGWSPDNIRGKSAAEEHLASIDDDPGAFLALLDDPEARGPAVTLPDGSPVPRLPSVTRWICDGGFCGSIVLRWQPGTSSLPPYVLGHVGYAIVPWKRGRGYATEALRLLLPEAWRLGLEHVELVTDPDDIASQRVIQANDGRLIERFREPAAYGGNEALRWRIVGSTAIAT
jgi:predicted acetyltransferase